MKYKKYVSPIMGTVLIGFLLGTLIWGQEKHTSFNISLDKGVI